MKLMNQKYVTMFYTTMHLRIDKHFLKFIVSCFKLMIISAAKDVASAFSDVTLKSKNASGKNMSDLEMLDLEKSTEVSLNQCHVF